jgi:diguanylate cyclase (GGDEF)-like protein
VTDGRGSTILAFLPITLAMPKSWDGRLARPDAWMGTVVLVAFAAVGLQTAGTDWAWVESAAIAGVLVLAAARWVPWARLPLATLLLPALGCDLVIVLLRQAQGGITSGYAPLAVLPVIFVGLALRRRHVVAMSFVTVLTFAVPILVAGAPMYPSSGWRAVVLWAVVSLIAGGGASLAMAVQRASAEQSEERARELDSVVATQTLIATSSFDAEDVMSCVVNEAQRLTGADAAVVELPNGDELVYRAASGTATEYLGLRLKQATALSGAAIRSGSPLVCRDSETDARVNRDACRHVGARSLVVVPLQHDGAVRGVLKVSSTRPDAFADRHVQLLTLLANLIGGALARADLVERLRDRADTDPLTALPNRRSWYERLAESLARARRYQQPLSVILLDLDDFKQVNDTQGHAAGDRLLRTVASHWTSLARDTDVVGRIGGDEFAVILEQAEEHTAREVANRLVRGLPAGRRCSVGVASWDGDEDALALVTRADAGMYMDKRSAKGSALGSMT